MGLSYDSDYFQKVWGPVLGPSYSRTLRVLWELSEHGDVRVPSDELAQLLYVEEPVRPQDEVRWSLGEAERLGLHLRSDHESIDQGRVFLRSQIPPVPVHRLEAFTDRELAEHFAALPEINTRLQAAGQEPVRELPDLTARWIRSRYEDPTPRVRKDSTAAERLDRLRGPQHPTDPRPPGPEAGL